MFHVETGRLVLKTHTFDNLARLCEWANDPMLLFYNDNQPEPGTPITVSCMEDYLGHMTGGAGDEATIHFGIHRKSDGELIGFAMIGHIDRYNRSCKFGITIGLKTVWGKGYGGEVVRAVLQYAFGELGMNRVGADIYAMNERSIRLFEKAGFRREGTIRQAVLKGGKFVNEYHYGILRDEWQAGQ